ncbi:MAG: Na(+)-translocating NADH-quinone reductase subunit A [Bacteroidetes bacterium]|nr:MAG: Na(+)-translocating NADH-quinone reductase subunit A [Bacteroidota bacterium]MBL1144575.1 Na(+)-translocating NADH-quinone reductase subunit A [Bacteroidota bacterium]NOG57370.1 Na(+)-translocating NADH-quinone reductase subunit A [Bacteroidota bacterium]
MSKVLKIKKGTDIKLIGEAEKVVADAPYSETIAIKPTDFPGLKPKMAVKVGDEVKAGTTLFYDKDNEQIKFASPVSGEIAEIKRGEKRVILEVVVIADKEIKYEDFKAADPSSLSKDEILAKMTSSGVWPFVKQRPYDVVANPTKNPKAIFISAFDSAPLAADNDFIMHGENATFQKGIDALAKLTAGKVHLTINGAEKADEVFTSAKNVQLNKISGPHPAGNVGVQIHHIDPIAKGEVVWTVKPQDVLIIGRLFETGKFDASRVVAVTGPQIKNPKYYKTILGTNTKALFSEMKDGISRFISGNVLTGTRINQDGYLGFYDTQLTSILEGGKPRMFGWITPNPDQFSISRTLVSWLTPNKKYNLTADQNGEGRPFVVTEEYEKVFPFDIYPVQLIKSIMIDDIELMENLGIYEVAPEDFALCETICTSKIESQKIVRDGLLMLKAEMS